jgi:hypothetical protein
MDAEVMGIRGLSERESGSDQVLDDRSEHRRFFHHAHSMPQGSPKRPSEQSERLFVAHSIGPLAFTWEPSECFERQKTVTANCPLSPLSP